MKKSAVEWLVNEIPSIDWANSYWSDRFKHAKELEKQQQGYSEEDLREAFKQSRQALIFEKDMPPVYNDFEEWFEQFKKK
jgi:hypothetical protein